MQEQNKSALRIFEDIRDAIGIPSDDSDDDDDDDDNDDKGEGLLMYLFPSRNII